jgi:hypothetical protein
MAGVEESLLRRPVDLAVFYAAMLIVLRGLSWLERRELIVDDSLIYEDEPDPIVRSLELG